MRYVYTEWVAASPGSMPHDFEVVMIYIHGQVEMAFFRYEHTRDGALHSSKWNIISAHSQPEYAYPDEVKWWIPLPPKPGSNMHPVGTGRVPRGRPRKVVVE